MVLSAAALPCRRLRCSPVSCSLRTMSHLRIVGLLVLVAAVVAAPTGDKVAAQSTTEDQLAAASLVWPGGARTRAAGEERRLGRLGRRPERFGRRQERLGRTSEDDVEVSVSTSTSVEISTVTSSVSSEMELLPVATGRSLDAPRAVETPGAEAAPEAELVPGAELEQEMAEASEKLKSVAGETVDVQTSSAVVEVENTTSPATETESETSAVSEKAESTTAGQTTAASPAEVSSTAAAESSEAPQAEEEGEEALKSAEETGAEAAPGVESEGSNSTEATEAASTTTADQNSTATAGADSTSSTTEEASTVKGTLIFDLGPGTSDELHDLVQQTVLDALMDEGLLSAAAVAAATPVIEAEGSGIVYLEDELPGSGDGEDVGEGRSSSPFVSIHF